MQYNYKELKILQNKGYRIMEYSGFDIIAFLSAGIVVLFFVIVFAIKFFLTMYLPFVEEREYIEEKIKSKSGEERQFWEAELKNLYIGIIPFIGDYIVRKSRRRKRK